MKPVLVVLDLDKKVKIDILDYATKESFIDGVCRWKMKTSSLPFQAIE